MVATSLDTFTLTLNSLITFFCGFGILYFIYSKRIEKHPFYYLWSLGFLAYALQIFTRIFFENYILLTVLMIGSFSAFSFGLLSLNWTKLRMIPLSLVYFGICLAFLVWIFNLIPLSEVKILGVLLNYGVLTLFTFYHRVNFGSVADRFVLGWFLLLISNVVLIGNGWLNDVFAIVSKLTLLLGIIDQNFAVITQRIHEGMIPQLPPYDVGFRREGGLTLIYSSSNFSHSNKMEWLLGKIRVNIEAGKDTYIFSFQDVTPHEKLRKIKWINPTKVFIFLFSSSAEKAKKEFTVLPMGVTEIGAALSEVIKKHKNSEESCTIILTDLSVLIHVFGAHTCYTMLLNKMGALREAGIELLAFFHPETHSDKSVVSLFTNICDEVMK